MEARAERNGLVLAADGGDGAGELIVASGDLVLYVILAVDEAVGDLSRWGVELEVVDLTGGGVAAAVDDALLEDMLRDINVDEDVRGDTHLGQRLGLLASAGEAIEDPATLESIGLGEAVANDRDHDVIRDKLASLHDSIALETELGASLNLSAERVTSRDVHVFVLLDELLALGTLPGTRGTSDDNVGGHDSFFSTNSPESLFIHHQTCGRTD